MDDLAQSRNRLMLSDREGPGCCLLDDESNEKFSILYNVEVGFSL